MRVEPLSRLFSAIEPEIENSRTSVPLTVPTGKGSASRVALDHRDPHGPNRSPGAITGEITEYHEKTVR
jgi:hypothetical protein